MPLAQGRSADIANVKEIDRLKTYPVTLPGVDKVITVPIISNWSTTPICPRRSKILEFI